MTSYLINFNVNIPSMILGNIGFIKSTSPVPPKSPSPASKKPEVTSILKHKTSLNKSNVNLSGSSSLFSSEDVSEDSASQGAHSELSDEPVVGRRSARERGIESDDSDSDWETYRVSVYLIVILLIYIIIFFYLHSYYLQLCLDEMYFFNS